jgi:hypothetical protein
MLSNPEYHGIGVGDGSGKRGMYASEFRDFVSFTKSLRIHSGCSITNLVHCDRLEPDGATFAPPPRCGSACNEQAAFPGQHALCEVKAIDKHRALFEPSIAV